MHRSLAVTLLLVVALAGRAALQEHDHHATEAAQNPHAAHQANEAMADMGKHHGDPHVKMTSRRSLTSEDQRRADAIVRELKSALERYEDYRVAIDDGYQPFLPNLPLPEYHFTNYRQAVRAAFSFDPARPTSLLYRKRGNGYELTGAMYTAPRSFTEEQLHERVPISVAAWHAHVNICLPPRGTERPDWRRFGLKGSIVTEAACDDADGSWFPQIFGWMVHVYPYQTTAAKIWAH